MNYSIFNGPDAFFPPVQYRNGLVGRRQVPLQLRRNKRIKQLKPLQGFKRDLSPSSGSSSVQYEKATEFCQGISPVLPDGANIYQIAAPLVYPPKQPSVPIEWTRTLETTLKTVLMEEGLTTTQAKKILKFVKPRKPLWEDMRGLKLRARIRRFCRLEKQYQDMNSRRILSQFPKVLLMQSQDVVSSFDQLSTQSTGWIPAISRSPQLLHVPVQELLLRYYLIKRLLETALSPVNTSALSHSNVIFDMVMRSDKTLSLNLQTWSRLIPKADIFSIMLKHPKIFYHDSRTLTNRLAHLAAIVGKSEAYQMFKSMPQVLEISSSNVDQTIAKLPTALNRTHDDVLTMIRGHPCLLCSYSIETLAAKTQVLTQLLSLVNLWSGWSAKTTPSSFARVITASRQSFLRLAYLHRIQHIHSMVKCRDKCTVIKTKLTASQAEVNRMGSTVKNGRCPGKIVRMPAAQFNKCYPEYQGWYKQVCQFAPEQMEWVEWTRVITKALCNVYG